MKMRIIILDEFPLNSFPKTFTALFDRTIPEWLREDVYNYEFKCYAKDEKIISWLSEFLRMKINVCNEPYSFNNNDLIYVISRNPLGGFDVYRVTVVEGCWL
jgi:hypothetical protein